MRGLRRVHAGGESMKAKKAAPAYSGPSRLGILGVVLLVVELGGCTLDSSGIVGPKRLYNLSATIQSSDGVRSEVSSRNLMMFAGDSGPIFAFHGPTTAREGW